MSYLVCYRNSKRKITLEGLFKTKEEAICYISEKSRKDSQEYLMNKYLEDDPNMDESYRKKKAKETMNDILALDGGNSESWIELVSEFSKNYIVNYLTDSLLSSLLDLNLVYPFILKDCIFPKIFNPMIPLSFCLDLCSFITNKNNNLTNPIKHLIYPSDDNYSMIVNTSEY